MPRSDLSSSKRRYLAVAESLLGSIADGAFKVGDRLPPDREIGATHKVSRVIAREALLALEMLGAVDIRPGKGVYVRRAGPQGSSLDATSLPNEWVEARSYFEPVTAKMAATVIAEETIDRLHRELEEARSLLAEDSQVERFMELNQNLHIELAAGCGNSVMATMVTDLVNVEAHPLWRLINRQVNSTLRGRQLQIAEHERILAAVTSRSPELAYRAMCTHLDSVRRTLFLKGRGQTPA